MQIFVRVIPGARINSIVVGENNSCAVHTTAVADKGRANAAVIKLLSEHFNIAKSKIKLIRGETSRNKIFQIVN